MSNIDDLHTALSEYITPLLTQIKFKGPVKKNWAYEYHYYFYRRDIAIDYFIEIGNNLPVLSIEFFKEPFRIDINTPAYSSYNYLDLTPDPKALDIYKRHSKRIEPTVKEYVQHLEKPERKILYEKIDEDYKLNGHNELNKIVIITWEFLKNNVDLLKIDDSLKIRRVLRQRVRIIKIKKITTKIKNRIFKG